MEFKNTERSIKENKINGDSLQINTAKDEETLRITKQKQSRSITRY